MNWKNLKENKCPKCSKSLIEQKWPNGKREYKNEKGKYFFLCNCGFQISEQRFGEIVSKIVKEELDRSS